MPELTPSRKHLARRGYGRGGMSIRCSCGEYEPVLGTAREQEDAHRAHRVAMGEQVRPRVPSPLENANARIAELEDEVADLEKALGLNETVGGRNA